MCCQNNVFGWKGINQCTAILENAFQQHKHQIIKCKQTSVANVPLESNTGKKSKAMMSSVPTIILVSRDVRPAKILAHIPIYAKLLNIPTLILPGKASVELGRAVGIRTVSVALFLPSFEESLLTEDQKRKVRDICSQKWKLCQDDID